MNSQIKIHNYKELKFWKTAFQVTLMVVKLSEKFPNKRVYWIIADQLIRAASSVGANIAEGFGRFHKKEKQKFYYNARGSLYESIHWTDKSRARKLITPDQDKYIYARLDKLPREINWLIKITEVKLKM